MNPHPLPRESRTDHVALALGPEPEMRLAPLQWRQALLLNHALMLCDTRVSRSACNLGVWPAHGQIQILKQLWDGITCTRPMSNLVPLMDPRAPEVTPGHPTR